MKKRIISYLIFVIMLALTLTGCGKSDPVIEVKVKDPQPSITINVDEVYNYDYTQHFIITEDGNSVTVKNDYLNLSNIKNEVGSYVVICTYKNKVASLNVIVGATGTVAIIKMVDTIDVTSVNVLIHDYKQYFCITDDAQAVIVLNAYIDLSNLSTAQGTYTVTCTYKGTSESISVNVTEVTYQLKLPTKEITVKQSEAESYDYNSLFTAVVNGKIYQITDEMVNSNVSINVGTYQYTVSMGETAMTLTVHVVSDYNVQIVNSYNVLEIEENLVNDFDFTTLFTVYVDGAAREVTPNMIDKSSLNTPNSDNLYQIKITYTEGQVVAYGSCYIKIVPVSTITVSTKNIITYPNSEHIDLTTLFEIKKGTEVIPVTADMISGSINSASVGVNVITLTYNGQTYTSTVEVKQGVIINHAKSDVVKVIKGTAKDTYQFADDFVVIINGIRFTDVAKYINTSSVNFDSVGTYTATITIPYKDSSLGITQTTNFTQTITYEVVDVTYDIIINNALVELKQGTTSYDVFDNLIVRVNGVKQKLVKSPTQESVIATYAVVRSEPIDFNYIGVQKVVVDIYVYGSAKEPVTITFDVIIISGVEITTQDVLILEGDTIYTIDVFTVTLNGEEVEVTQDMISGKVDSFTPGVYPVTINYQGIVKTTNVIVLNKEIVGTYKTNLSTIAISGSTDEEGYEDEGTASVAVKNLYITDDGRISIDGILATILYGIDENTIYIKVGSNEFTLFYNNGIVVAEPNNAIKLAYVDHKRPYIYFNEEMWEIVDKVTINSTDHHVLGSTTSCYTLDAFQIKNLKTNTTMWYGLMIDLYEKISSDTNYLVTHGEVVFDSNWNRTEGAHSSLQFNGKAYEFNMVSNTVAKIGAASTTVTYKYAGLTFNGTYNNQTATLSVDMYEGYVLRVNGEIVMNVTGSSVRNQKYGGVNYSTDEVLIVSEGSNTVAPYSYKFILNVDTLTFTYVEKDTYFGRYTASSAYIFFDGYGSGLINFDTKQYAVTKLKYTLQGNEIRVDFVDTKPSFKHGTYATLYIDPLYTTLTSKYFVDENLRGIDFVNNNITDGAIINITTYQLNSYSSKVLGRKALFDVIKIYLPTGEVTDNNLKIQMIDINDIDFATSGFYHFSITCTVGGNEVVMHYTLQII